MQLDRHNFCYHFICVRTKLARPYCKHAGDRAIFFQKHSFTFAFTSVLLEEPDKTRSDFVFLNVFFICAIGTISPLTIT